MLDLNDTFNAGESVWLYNRYLVLYYWDVKYLSKTMPLAVSNDSIKTNYEMSVPRNNARSEQCLYSPLIRGKVFGVTTAMACDIFRVFKIYQKQIWSSVTMVPRLLYDADAPRHVITRKCGTITTLM